RLVLIAATGLIVLAGLVSVCYSQLSSRDEELSFLNNEITELDQQLLKYQDDGKKLKALDTWTQNSVSLLDELYDLTEQIPALEKLRVTSLSFRPAVTLGKDNPFARAEMDVITNDCKV